MAVRRVTSKSQRVRIVNVNDRPAPRYLITKMLTGGGYEVIDAENGAQALEIAQREPISLMVLDIQLPDIDGFEICRRLKSDPSTSHIALLMTSATFVTLDTKVTGLDSGADGYLAQPFGVQELLATVRSLLRLKEGEQEQRVRAESLADADRRKDEFLAMLAHELRNPLAAIVSSLAVLDDYPPRDELEGKARRVTARQTNLLVRLVDDLLDVSRVMRGLIELRKAPVDLRQVLEQVVELSRHQYQERKQTLKLEVPSKAVVVNADRQRLQQVFQNLIDNASKYGKPDGKTTVLLGVEPGDSEPPEAVVSIKDDGLGISKEMLPSVFNLFYQAHASMARSSGGLGIGLTLVRTLTELHGGRVAATSLGAGRGSEFQVVLPVHAGAVVQESGGAGTRPSDSKLEPLRILVVEDNVDARVMLCEALKRWGHDVKVAEDGLAGVELAKSVRPDVALIDLGLPMLDGLEVARRIRADNDSHEVRLIAVSGYGSPDMRSAAQEAGFDVHLVKPVQLAELKQIISEAVNPR